MTQITEPTSPVKPVEKTIHANLWTAAKIFVWYLVSTTVVTGLKLLHYWLSGNNFERNTALANSVFYPSVVVAAIFLFIGFCYLMGCEDDDE